VSDGPFPGDPTRPNDPEDPGATRRVDPDATRRVDPDAAGQFDPGATRRIDPDEADRTRALDPAADDDGYTVVPNRPPGEPAPGEEEDLPPAEDETVVDTRNRGRDWAIGLGGVAAGVLLAVIVAFLAGGDDDDAATASQEQVAALEAENDELAAENETLAAERESWRPRTRRSRTSATTCSRRTRRSRPVPPTPRRLSVTRTPTSPPRTRRSRPASRPWTIARRSRSRGADLDSARRTSISARRTSTSVNRNSASNPVAVRGRVTVRATGPPTVRWSCPTSTPRRSRASSRASSTGSAACSTDPPGGEDAPRRPGPLTLARRASIVWAGGETARAGAHGGWGR
jgi:hypothetical protein